jgi:uncharacterized protein YfbU (UPF0304 family)
MATISFRIEDELKSRLDRLAEQRGLNISHLFRETLSQKVDELEHGRNERASLPLTIKERLTLATQYRLLAAVSKEEEESNFYQRNVEALEGGYELHYRDLVSHFAELVSYELSIEVLDILSMYDDIGFSHKALVRKEGIKDVDIRFLGFDGNYESVQFRYANYVLGEKDRFVNLQANKKRYGLNSHMPMLSIYRRMLPVWRNRQQMPQPLSADCIKAIVQSGLTRRSGG